MKDDKIEKLKTFVPKDGEVTEVRWIEAVKAPEPNPLGIRVENPGSYYRVTMKLQPCGAVGYYGGGAFAGAGTLER